MPARHRKPESRPVLNRRLGAVGVAGLAGLATAFAAAPAHADPAPSTNTTSAAPDPGAAAAEHASTAPKASTSVRQIKADFGNGKIRVGVKIKDGAYVPPGTTTVGTEITIVETGDDVEGGTKTTTCRTDASTVEPGSTASYCVWNDEPGQLVDYYISEPDDSVSITQTTVNKYLAIDTSVKKFGPCTADDDSGYCDPVTAVFVDPGLPPKAVDDSAKTKANVPVDIDVLANDDPGEPGAPVTITNVTSPKHGTVVLGTGASSRTGKDRAAPITQTLQYKPDHNFTGVDHFHYTISTPNGTSSALVTVKVTAPPPIARDDHARTEQDTAVTIDVENNDSARYPNTHLTLEAVGTPSHGTARIHGNQIIYTPDHGFSGTDRFPYTVSTPFGTATADVTVVVPAAVPIAVTGPDVEQGLGIALGLLAAGGGLATAGRRRRRHA